MFCTNCGNKLEETDKFCIHCGSPTSNHQPDAPRLGDSHSLTEEKIDQAIIPMKRKKRIIPIIAGILTLVVLVGGMSSFLLYRKHFDKQADIVMAYIDDREYDQAVALYRKYSGKKESFDEKIFIEIKNVTEQIKNDYLSEDIDYNFAKGQLGSLNDFDITGLDLIIYDCARWIDKINTSRENYQDGKTYYELGDYDRALEKYGLVLEEDSRYYDRAGV